jgi:hypothetical protein
VTSPYNPQPFPQPPQPPRKRHTLRNVLLSITGLLAVLIAIGVAAGGSKTPSPAVSAPAAPATSSPASPSAAAASSPGIGATVRDGDFAFVVKHESCGAAAAAAVDPDGMGTAVPPGAVECIFTITVTDDKGTAQTFFDSAQFAYDASGKQYSADSDAGVLLPGDADGKQVNPGITLTAKLPFQFPAGAKIVRLVLHDSMFSGGVAVRL